jgi:hypothetical protein
MRNNPLQAKWKPMARQGSIDSIGRTGEEERRHGNSQDDRANSPDSPRQESVSSPKHPPLSDAGSKHGDDLSPTPLNPSELINELHALASSLVQLAYSLEQLEAILHRSSTSGPPKESVTPNLSQLVRDRPDLQEILRQYLFKS